MPYDSTTPRPDGGWFDRIPSAQEIRDAWGNAQQQSLQQQPLPTAQEIRDFYSGMAADPLGNAALVTAPVPVVGDITGLAADAQMYATDPESRTWGNYGLSALGALPFVPSMAAISRAAGVPVEQALDMSQEARIDALRSGIGSNLVDLFHGTTPEAFESINEQGILNGPAYFTPRRSIAEDYGDLDSILEVRLPSGELMVDLDLPGGQLLPPQAAAGFLDWPSPDDATIEDFIDGGYSVGVKKSVLLR